MSLNRRINPSLYVIHRLLTHVEKSFTLQNYLIIEFTPVLDSLEFESLYSA